MAPTAADTSTVSLPSRPAPTSMKSPRILACVQCQQRKIKCNREFPCSHCTKAGTQCVPANLVPKQRRRRFPERELLHRLRQYETLLKENNIDFQPLHPSSSRTREGSTPDIADNASIADTSEPLAEETPASNFWSALTQTPAAEDDQDDHSGSDSDFNVQQMGERMVRKAWEHSHYRKEDLIFGTPIHDLNLSLLHPSPAQMFKLWQLYVDNVDPLLKVTHSPTLQPRIIDAMSALTNLSPAFHALLFSIYCMAIISMTKEECWTMLAEDHAQLLGGYQFACQQALLQAAFLRTEDLDCLTAFHLYTISMKPDIDARALASSVGVAIRIGQRMGLHDESTHMRYSALQAELRRRLWWSLVIFDNRMCEMSNALKATVLLPTWNCRPPGNFNDFDLQAETKVTPNETDGPSQSLFVAVRCQIADMLRHSTWYLDFNNPSLKSLTKKPQPSLNAFEEFIESRSLRLGNLDNPLHFMTIWLARGLMAKNRFWDHISKYPAPTSQQPDSERDVGVSFAIRYIECDTQLLSSPLTKRFKWYTKTFSFFPAYIHIIQDLRKRPLSRYAERAWEVMSKDWAARHHFSADTTDNPFFTMFSRIVLLAWEAREAALQHEVSKFLPDLVTFMYAHTAPKPGSNDRNGQMPAAAMDVNLDDFLMNLMPMPIDMPNEQLQYSAPS